MSSVYPFPTVERSRPDRGAYAARIIYARGDTFNNAGTRYIVNTGHFVSGSGGRTFAQELAAGFFIVDPNPPSTGGGPILPALTAAQANHYYRINAAGNAVNTTATIPTKITPWAASTAVEAGETRSINATLYTSNSNRTTGAAFNAAEVANWSQITGRYRALHVANAFYHVGDLISDPTDNGLYRCTTAHVAGATRAANPASWTVASAIQYAGDWAGTTQYAVGNVVHDAGHLYRCTTTHVSGATLAAHAGNWRRLDANLFAWSPNTRVEANELRAQNNVLYRATATRTTGAAFDAAEAGNWLRLTNTGARDGIFSAIGYRATLSVTTLTAQFTTMTFVNPATGLALTTTLAATAFTTWTATAIGIYDIYLFCDPLGGGIEAVDVAQGGAPTAPAGKPYRAFLGGFRRDGVNSFARAVMSNRRILTGRNNVVTLGGGTITAADTQWNRTSSYAAFVPAGAAEILFGRAKVGNGAALGAASAAFSFAADTAGTGNIIVNTIQQGVANQELEGGPFWYATSPSLDVFWGFFCTTPANLTNINNVIIDISGYGY